jgi:hypothetical protein
MSSLKSPGRAIAYAPHADRAAMIEGFGRGIGRWARRQLRPSRLRHLAAREGSAGVLSAPYISDDNSTGRMRSHSGQTATRPLRGNVDVKATCDRVSPTIRIERIAWSQCGQRTATSSV